MDGKPIGPKFGKLVRKIEYAKPWPMKSPTKPSSPAVQESVLLLRRMELRDHRAPGGQRKELGFPAPGGILRI